MAQQLTSRLLWVVPTLLTVTFLVFALMELAPGDAARTVAGQEATPEMVAAVRAELHLDDPLPTRYARWLGGVVQGDMGDSLVTPASVSEAVWRALPKTLGLIAVSITFSMIGALLLGGLPAIWPNRVFDRLMALVSSLGIAMPSFWLALVLVGVFALDRTWLPALGYVPPTEDPGRWLAHLVLPGLALAAVTVGEVGRQLRGALGDVMQQDFILAARARGLRFRRILLKHGLKNAAVPVVTVLGIRMSQLIGGTVIVEKIFLIDGLGNLAITAVHGRDIPMILGIVVVATVLVQLINLVVDASYVYFNPRLRAE